MHRIDFNAINAKEEFHQIIKKELDFPDYYGGNLDALHDCLGEISEPTELEFVESAQYSEEMTKLLAGLKRLMEDIVLENSNVKVNWVGSNMEFRDLKKQYKVLKDKIDEAMVEVATQCNFISGGPVKDFEEKIARYVGTKHGVTCANGTDALSIAMMVWGIGPGDGVFVPDFTFFASGEIVSHCGATPIFVDVDKRTFNMDPEALKSAIGKVLQKGVLTPKVVVAVDLFGLPANYQEIRKICDEYGLLLLEDGAQGFGGAITTDGKTRRACSFGDISTTSFFPAKPLGCYGDGGALFTDNDQWAELMRSVCVHGKGEMKYDNVRIGLNSRLDTIQAAILDVKMDAFDEYELDDVNKVAGWYDERLLKIGTKLMGEEKTVVTGKGKVVLPLIPESYYSSWAQYTLQLENREIRDSLQVELKNKGIPTMIYYPKAMHNQVAFGIDEPYDFDCENTKALCDTVLSLPMHPYMTEEDVDRVVSEIASILA